MAKLKRRRERPRISAFEAKRRMERGDVLYKKLAQAMTGLRVFWIVFTFVGSLRALLGFIVEPWVGTATLAILVGNIVFCELVLIRNLRKYREWTRKLSIAYLLCASIITPFAFSLFIGAFVVIATVPGFMAMLDSRTKRVFAEERERLARLSSPDNCPECGKPVTEESIPFGDRKVCPGCKDKHVQRLKEGVGQKP